MTTTRPKLTHAQRQALRMIVGRGDEDGRPKASLRANGVRQPTLDYLERHGFVFSKWVTTLSKQAVAAGVTGHAMELAYVESSDSILEYWGLERSEDNPELWITVRPGGRRLSMWFIGEPGKRWWGRVTRGGDQWDAKADTIFELMDDLYDLSNEEGK